jgi:hypothetical protein
MALTCSTEELINSQKPRTKQTFKKSKQKNFWSSVKLDARQVVAALAAKKLKGGQRPTPYLT